MSKSLVKLFIITVYISIQLRFKIGLHHRADNSQLDDPGNVPIHNGLTPFGKVRKLIYSRVMNIVALTWEITLKACYSGDESIGDASGFVACFKKGYARWTGSKQSACYFLSLVSVLRLQ